MPRSPVVLALILAASAAADTVQLSYPGTVPHTAIVRDPVVAAGDGFLVAWREDSGSFRVPSPVKVRVFDGVAWRQPIPTELGDGTSVHAVWNATGSQWLVVRTHPGYYFTSRDVIVTAVSPDGTRGGDHILARPRNSSRVIAVARHGPGAAVLAECDGVIHLFGVNWDGSLSFDDVLDFEPAALAQDARGNLFILRRVDGDAIASTPGYERFAVIRNGSNGLAGVLYNQLRERIETFVIAADGGSARSIARDGQAFVTAYVDGIGRLCTARFTGAADVKTECGSESGAQPFLDAGRGGVFKAWVSQQTIRTDAGVASTRFTHASGPVSAVVDEAGVLAVWTESRGAVLGGVYNDRTLRPQKVLAGWSSPILARSGSQTLLVSTAGFVVATRVNANGDEVPPRVALGPGEYDVAVAARDGEWLVVWEAPGGIADEIVASRLTANLDSSGLEHFGTAGKKQDKPAAAPTRDGYLVVWSEREDAQEVWQSDVVVEALNANGQRVSGRIRIAENEKLVDEMGIGCGPASCLVVWTDFDLKIRAVPVRHDGTALGEPRVLMSTTNSERLLVRAQDDGSFRVYQGEQIAAVTAGRDVTRSHIAPGVGVVEDVVMWGRRTTLLYTQYVSPPDRSGSAWTTRQVFMLDIPPTRLRSVRH